MRNLSGRAPLTDELIAALAEGLFDGFTSATGPAGVRFVFGAYQPRRPIAAAALAPGAMIDLVGPYMMVNLGYTADSPLIAEIPNPWAATQVQLHDVMRTAVHGWHPGVVELVDRIDRSTLFPLSVRRVEPAAPWQPSRVTLLEDAIHAMPPTFGAGANSALRDAASLAAVLGSGCLAGARGRRSSRRLKYRHVDSTNVAGPNCTKTGTRSVIAHRWGNGTSS